MTLVWQIYWPVLVAVFIIGVVAGRTAFYLAKIADEAPQERKLSLLRHHRARRRKFLLIGLAAVLIAVPLWHGPLGGGDRFAARVESLARGELRWLEMPNVARLERGPLSRVLLLTGPANDFQQAELARILSTTPGVSRVRWPHQQGRGMPLVAELMLLSFIPFLLGLFFSYLVEIRRRVNAEWSW